MTRINFTGRKRLERGDIEIRVRNVDGVPVLDVLRLQLQRLALSAKARVVVEAYRETILMRFDLGTVGELALPVGQSLSEFDSPEVIRFRVKVIDVGANHGKLLAVADRLRPHLEEDGAEPHSSLLTTAPEDLGHVLWRLEIKDDEPKLLVNNAVGDWKGFAISPPFVAFVLPEALRQIAIWVAEEIDSLEDGDDTSLARWVSFFIAMGHDPHVGSFEDKRDRELWADEVAAQFSRKNRFRDLVADLIGGAEE